MNDIRIDCDNFGRVVCNAKCSEKKRKTRRMRVISIGAWLQCCIVIYFIHFRFIKRVFVEIKKNTQNLNLFGVFFFACISLVRFVHVSHSSDLSFVVVILTNNFTIKLSLEFFFYFLMFKANY